MLEPGGRSYRELIVDGVAVMVGPLVAAMAEASVGVPQFKSIPK